MPNFRINSEIINQLILTTMKKIILVVAAVALLAGATTAFAQFGFGAPQQQSGEPKAPDIYSW